MKRYIPRIGVAVATFLLGLFAIYVAPGLGTLLSLTVLCPSGSCYKSAVPETVEETSFGCYPDWKSGTQKSDLFVFVGEKIEVVDYMPPGVEYTLDYGYYATYRIIQPVFGEFEGDIITFQAWDHYGYPPFAAHKYALLFISKEDGTLYHEKYQYYPVSQTTDGRWAACGDPYLIDEYHRKAFTPKALEFTEPVTFRLRKLTKRQIEKIYPSPYYEIKNGEAVCKMGAYVDELFEIKRNGVLKARGVGQK